MIIIIFFRVDAYCSVQASCTYDELKQEAPYVEESAYEAVKQVCTTQSEACKDAIGEMMNRKRFVYLHSVRSLNITLRNIT